MKLSEAEDIFECISNLETEKLMSYYAKRYLAIRDAARIALKAIRDRKVLDEKLKYWEVLDEKEN